MKKIILIILGIIVGIINVTLGAGAGIVAVKILKKLGFSQKESQANAIVIILPLSIISLIIYFSNGYVNLSDNVFLIPCAIIGAFLGTKILRKAPDKILKISFGLFMIWAGVRLIINL